MATVEQRQARAMAKALGISYTLALRQIREAYATADIKMKRRK